MDAFEGKRLRYLIGTETSGPGRDDEVTEVSYGTTEPARHGISIAYCNLFDEHNTGRYGPYLHTSDTAAEYNEGQMDPRGPGWEKNLRQQFERRKKQGFEYIELDNPDAYSIKDVIGAIDLAASYGIKVIAKNPNLMEGDAAAYVAHPNVHGIIVERDAGGAGDMDTLRRKAGKPTLPVWFVAFGVRARVGRRRRQRRQALSQHERELFERRGIWQLDRHPSAFLSQPFCRGRWPLGYSADAASAVQRDVSDERSSSLNIGQLLIEHERVFCFCTDLSGRGSSAQNPVYRGICEAIILARRRHHSAPCRP